MTKLFTQLLSHFFRLRCRRQCRLRSWICTGFLVIVTSIVMLFLLPDELEEILFKNSCATPLRTIQIGNASSNLCNIPKINPFDREAMRLVEEVGPLRCDTTEKAILKGGILTIIDPSVANALYRKIIRPKGSDFDSLVGDLIQLELSAQKRQFAVKEEYIELVLEFSDGSTAIEYLLQAVAKEEIRRRPKLDSGLNLSVIVIGLETVSHAHAQRKIPKSYKYMKENLGGFIFNGHSVVGDGTTEQVAAMLTGKGERDYGDARRKTPGAKPVDNWNWIFKDAKAKGYVTSFSEDAPDVGTFQYRLTGFYNPPTDYYPRAFYIEAYKQFENRRENVGCIGSQKIHNYHLDLTRRIYEEYPDRHKFLYNFESELSHDYFNNIQKMDDDLLNFMIEFKEKGYFDNTVLILMGDHGWRYGDFRQTIQGKLEERLPLFTMSFPKSFKQRHMDLVKILKTNTDRLTSWYDVYATLKHLLDFPHQPKNLHHGISLFTEVPRQRTCDHAGIPMHWCPCVSWSEVSNSHHHIKKAAMEVVKYINDLNSNEALASEKCSKLNLNEVSFGEVETPGAEVLRFDKTVDGDGFTPTYGQVALAKNVCRYRVSLTTSPSNAQYEASVNYIYGKFVVERGLNRVNAYGKQPNCIASALPSLRKFCFCKAT